MAAGRGHRVPVEPDHQERAVRDLAGELDHARAGGQQMDGRRRGAEVPEPARRVAERDRLAGEETAQTDDRLAHRVHGGAPLPHAPGRKEARRHGEAGPSRRELVEAVGQGRQENRVTDGRARGRRVETDAARTLGGQRQDDIGVARAVRMVVDADAVEAGVLAPRDEIDDRGNRATDRHADVEPHRRDRPTRDGSRRVGAADDGAVEVADPRDARQRERVVDLGLEDLEDAPDASRSP